MYFNPIEIEIEIIKNIFFEFPLQIKDVFIVSNVEVK